VLAGVLGLSAQLVTAKKFMLKVPTTLLRFINEDLITNRLKYIALFLWVLVPFIFMEYLINIPGTHIYTYLIPVFIVMAFGVDLIVKSFAAIKLKKPAYFGVIAMFLFIFLQTHTIFVDNSLEYPWENKKFLVWSLPTPSATYHLSLFGFPYFRDWDGIRDYILKANNAVAYATNERDTISSYYIPLKRDRTKAGYYIYIKHPQNFLPPAGLKPKLWISKYPPVKEIVVNGRVLTSLYLMETGDYDDLKAKGF
jgi:hypothetical protein